MHIARHMSLQLSGLFTNMPPHLRYHLLVHGDHHQLFCIVTWLILDTGWEFPSMATHNFFLAMSLTPALVWYVIMHIGNQKPVFVFRYDWSNDWRGYSSCNGRRENLCPLSSWSLCSWQLWLWSNEGIPEQVDAGIRKWFQVVRHAFTKFRVWVHWTNMTRDVGTPVCKKYEHFFLLCCRSMAICQLVYRYPILLDAATAAVMRKGDRFLARWGDIMTGGSPKFHLLHPDFVIVITFELVLLFIKRLFGFQSVTKKKQEWPMCLSVKDQLGIAFTVSELIV